MTVGGESEIRGNDAVTATKRLLVMYLQLYELSRPVWRIYVLLRAEENRDKLKRL
jgi:hypothetical protein